MAELAQTSGSPGTRHTAHHATRHPPPKTTGRHQASGKRRPRCRVGALVRRAHALVARTLGAQQREQLLDERRQLGGKARQLCEDGRHALLPRLTRCRRATLQRAQRAAARAALGCLVASVVLGYFVNLCRGYRGLHAVPYYTYLASSFSISDYQLKPNPRPADM